MKHFTYATLPNRTMGFVFFTLAFLSSASVHAQVSKYERLRCIGRHTFNFMPDAQHPSLHKNKDLLVVYSDRDANKGCWASRKWAVLIMSPMRKTGSISW